MLYKRWTNNKNLWIFHAINYAQHHYIHKLLLKSKFFKSDPRNIVKIFENDSYIIILLLLELLFFAIPIFFLSISLIFFYNPKKNF